MIDTKDTIRRDRTMLELALRECGCAIRGNAVKCPAHDDRHASASIHPGNDGAWRVTCHTAACRFSGDVFDVRALRGRPVDQQLRELSQADRRPAPQPVRMFRSIDELKRAISGVEAVYVYTNPQTRAADMIVLRIRTPDGKRFIQASPSGAGFVLKAPPKPWPLYHRTRLASADCVIVVEGEKAVHALAELGIVATTAPGGAGKAALADWSPLAGKTVYLWPDADPPDPKTRKRAGIEHMQDVARELERLEPAPRVSWIDPDALSLPPKGDAVEFLDLYGGSTVESKAQAVRCILKLAEPMGASREVARLLEDAISGRRVSIPWPWPMLTEQSRALLPGTVTVLCGPPGATKSFVLLQAAAHWHKSGLKIAIYELEEDRAYHLRRSLAQLEQRAELCDDEWIKANPDESRSAQKRHEQFLDAFGKRMTVSPDGQVTLDQLADWAANAAAAGCRIIAIDPVTAAAASDKPWIDDLKFITRIKSIARGSGASFVLVTHPRKGGRTATAALNDLAGGAAYQRFAQTVLWIERLDKPKEFHVRSTHGPFNTRVNRIVRMLKTRNGVGSGSIIAMNFDGGSLLLSEQGVVLGKPKHNHEEEEEPVND